MNKGDKTKQKDSSGITLKIGDNVIDDQNSVWEVAFIEGLSRAMLDENIGMWSKMFELDAFPVRLVNER